MPGFLERWTRMSGLSDSQRHFNDPSNDALLSYNGLKRVACATGSVLQARMGAQFYCSSGPVGLLGKAVGAANFVAGSVGLGNAYSHRSSRFSVKDWALESVEVMPSAFALSAVATYLDPAGVAKGADAFFNKLASVMSAGAVHGLVAGIKNAFKDPQGVKVDIVNIKDTVADGASISAVTTVAQSAVSALVAGVIQENFSALLPKPAQNIITDSIAAIASGAVLLRFAHISEDDDEEVREEKETLIAFNIVLNFTNSLIVGITYHANILNGVQASNGAIVVEHESGILRNWTTYSANMYQPLEHAYRVFNLRQTIERLGRQVQDLENQAAPLVLVDAQAPLPVVPLAGNGLFNLDEAGPVEPHAVQALLLD